MKHIGRTLALALILLISTLNAKADTIDFKAMAEAAGSHGESAWDTLTVALSGFSLSVVGIKNGVNRYAYLDSGGAGLGVCGALVGTPNVITHSSNNLCNPGDDDNVTNGELLRFRFSTNVRIDRIWLINAHDGDFSLFNNTALIGGSAYTFTDGGANLDSSRSGPIFVNANTDFDIEFGGSNPDQFYISKLTVSAVPEPLTLSLLGLGLVGLGLVRKTLAAK